MHRNVTALILRQRRLHALPALPYAHECLRLYSSEDTQIETPRADPETTSTLQSYSDEETKRILQALDQRSLLDNKIKLNTLIPHYESLRSDIPALLPSTIPSQPGPKAEKEKLPVYTLALQRQRVNDLPKNVDAVLARTKHMRSHIQDLQSIDYAAKGDGLAAWKEEIEGMTAQKKRDKLVQLRYEEEGAFSRMMVGAEKNLERVKGIREKAAAKRGGGGVKARRVGGFGKRDEGRKVEGGEKQAVEEGKKIEEKPTAEQPGLAELARNLQREMMGKP